MCVDTDTGTRYAIKIFKKSLLKRRQSRFQGTAFDDVSLHGPADTALPGAAGRPAVVCAASAHMLGLASNVSSAQRVWGEQN